MSFAVCARYHHASRVAQTPGVVQVSAASRGVRTVTDEYLRRESSRADWAEDVVYKMSMHIRAGAGSRPGALTTESCMI